MTHRLRKLGRKMWPRCWLRLLMPKLRGVCKLR